MAPIPIYTNSPITAEKASGVTPQTASQEHPPRPHQPPAAPPTTTATAPEGYPAAQPGAAPRLAAPTGPAQAGRYAPLQPTPTQKLGEQTPPPPQPGAAPIPPSSKLPPPPRAGEQYHPPEPTPAPHPPRMGYPLPPQMGMAIQPPSLSQRGTASTSAAPLYSVPQPLGVGGPYGAQVGARATDSPSHPPGYYQDVNASEFTSHQRAAQNAQIEWERHQGGASTTSYEGDDEGVWGSAKKWAQSAGEKIAAAESEVWRRINKE
ncbi:hypothetical protein GQ53DRAFT_744208 [Thozetella sp. PMI_491]|nr:hypothetical protein GQ53DRAFT_744208 [Thozetella sp. PMI_491]